MKVLRNFNLHVYKCKFLYNFQILGCGKSPQSSKTSIWKKGQGYQAMPVSVTHQGRTFTKRILELNSFFLEIMDLKKKFKTSEE